MLRDERGWSRRTNAIALGQVLLFPEYPLGVEPLELVVDLERFRLEQRGRPRHDEAAAERAGGGELRVGGPDGDDLAFEAKAPRDAMREIHPV